MHRFAALLLCALVVGNLMAAPAPFPKPWGTGWDKPIDQVGDCTFVRQGDKLTITVPGKEDRTNSPRLLRDVEGDFVIQVRVGGAFRPTGKSGLHRAGLILSAGGSIVRFERCAGWSCGSPVAGPLVCQRPYQIDWARGGRRTVELLSFFAGPHLEKPVTLRLERAGATVRVSFRTDGAEWEQPPRAAVLKLTLPQKLKVGVIAESTTPATFQPTFDKFLLTKPAK